MENDDFITYSRGYLRVYTEVDIDTIIAMERCIYYELGSNGAAILFELQLRRVWECLRYRDVDGLNLYRRYW